MAVEQQVPSRVYFIDWLRILAVLMLVPFHTAMIFVPWDFHIKNPELSGPLTDFNSFIHMWHMPLLFFLSGAGTWFALGFRTARQYAAERTRRLFVPLVFGILVIVPPHTYFERVQKTQFQGSFLAFYPHIFNGVYPNGNFTWNHLWFLAYLFVFSMIALPILVRVRSDRGRRAVASAATFLAPRGRLLLLALPLMLIQATVRVRWSGVQNLVDDWANFFFYITMFLYGFLLCSHESFADTIARQRRLFLGLGLAYIFFEKVLDWTGTAPAWGYNPWNMTCLGLGAFNTWCWVLAFLGFGKAWLNHTNAFLRYATESALPFYILHQTVIIAVGFYVIQRPWPIFPKFVVIQLATLTLVPLILDLLVKRVNGLRFCFGMMPSKPYPPRSWNS